MIITFKNVGQGDSIVIEWTDQDSNKIGLIDCNRYSGKNPVLEHIKEKAYDSIEFAVLSHPHQDHYSGFIDLIEYCLENGIEIKRFYETSRHLDAQYWSYFEVDDKSTQQIVKLVQNISALYEADLTEWATLDVGTCIPLSQGTYLECLSPSRDEIREVLSMMNDDPDKNKKKVSESANLLSSVFILKTPNQSLFLSADAEIPTFDRLLNPKYGISKMAGNLRLVQVAHHGSYANFHKGFWTLVATGGGIAVTSAGIHGKYNHPNSETIEELLGLSLDIHSTNFVNGVKEILEKLYKTTAILDTTSELIIREHLEGDRQFEISEL
jgi:beta-lactamase superfamily II metal-dependent hydrolase